MKKTNSNDTHFLLADEFHEENELTLDHSAVLAHSRIESEAISGLRLFLTNC